MKKNNETLPRNKEYINILTECEKRELLKDVEEQIDKIKVENDTFNKEMCEIEKEKGKLPKSIHSEIREINNVNKMILNVLFLIKRKLQEQ